MSLPRDPRVWLFDVAMAVERVQRFLAHKSFAHYQADDLLRAGVERQFEIMGEALNQLRRHDAALVVDIREHQRIIGFRNVLIHGYATVDDGVVWDIATGMLSRLMADVQALLSRLNALGAGDAA